MDAPDLLQYALTQWRQEPATRVEDAYKWLLHATLGGEHAVVDDAGPRRWMDREWETLGEPFPGELAVVPLRPDGKLIRANLRPYKAAGGDKERMLQAFVASAKRFHADQSEFEGVWLELGAVLRHGQVGQLTYVNWSALAAAMKDEGYPAIDHSAEYEAARKPAYRVLLAELWR